MCQAIYSTQISAPSAAPEQGTEKTCRKRPLNNRQNKGLKDKS